MRETTKRWIAQHIFLDGEGTDWVLELKDMIKNVNLKFVAKFIWLLILHFLSPTAADKILKWDRAVLVAAIRPVQKSGQNH